MPEGRVVNVSGALTQEFIMTDQQGNARVAFRNVGNVAKVIQENSYYGTGLILPNSPVSTPTVANKKLYNGGSEWQNDSPVGSTNPYNLPDYYETDNRNYDATIGRFIGVDPMAESAESMSSYQYGGCNPIVNNDPSGGKFGTPVYGIPGQNEFNQGGETDLAAFYGDVAGVTDGGSGWGRTGPEATTGLFGNDDGSGGDNGSDNGIDKPTWDFIRFIAKYGPITKNYTFSNGMLRQITDPSAFSLGAAYANQYSMWGLPGVADDLSSAVLAYDRSPNRKGPGFTLNGKLLYIPDDSSDETGSADMGIMLANVTIPGKGNDTNWFEGVVKFVEPIDQGLTVAETPGLWNKAYRLASESSSTLEIIGTATGALTLVNNLDKTFQAWQSGDRASVIKYGILTVGQGAAMLFGEQIELGWNAGTLLYDWLSK